MKESFGRLEFGLTEMCFPSPGLEHKLKVIFEAALLHKYTLATSLEKIYSGILCGVATICLII